MLTLILSYNFFLLECSQVASYCQPLNLLNDRRKHEEKGALCSQEILHIFNIYLNFITHGESKHWQNPKVGSRLLLKRKGCSPLSQTGEYESNHTALFWFWFSLPNSFEVFFGKVFLYY